jgi:ABC-type dipeptide/oligopeptide/nickel transport system permease component
MGRLIAIRVLQAVPVILIVSVLAFLLMSLLPGCGSCSLRRAISARR